MLGTGMAFALLPLLRYVYQDRAELEKAVERHAGHFNAHPYMAELALGSLVRLEEDREDESAVRRFRTAVGGPLGALGDRVVWATWLPLCSLLALVALELGAGPWGAAILFLSVYNAGHLSLRVWAFRTGLQEGALMATRLRAAALTSRARQADTVVVVLVGLLAGLLLGGRGALAAASLPYPEIWPIGALVAGAVGVSFGSRVWRPAALVVVAAVAGLLVPDLLS
jgi:mannose/fructose/N-acetylgalactosamine-specific phosphotransferase system component IID